MADEKRRLEPVDGLRGFAILLVLLAHIHQALGFPYIQYDPIFATVDFARSGVDLFFVLSGFCLYYPLTKPGASPVWGRFFQRRARRLLPPYYAALGAIILAPFVIAPLARAAGLVTSAYTLPSWHLIWTHLLFVHPLFADSFYSLDGPLWSLGVEIQFYLAFPLAVWLVSRFEWRGVALIGAATLGFRLLVVSPATGIDTLPIDIPELFPSRWLEFGLGMLVAVRVRKRAAMPLSRRAELCDLAGLLVIYLLGAYYLYGPLGDSGYEHKDLLFAACYAVLLYLTCTPSTLLRAIFSLRALVWLGTISYSVYLIHVPIIFALAPQVTAMHLTNYDSMLVLATIALPIVLICSTVFFHFVERPFLNSTPAKRAQPALKAGQQVNRPGHALPARADP